MDVKEILKQCSEQLSEAVEELKAEDEKFPHVVVKAEKVVEVLKWFKEKGFEHLSAISSVDDPPERIWLVYHLVDINSGVDVAVKAAVSRQEPQIESVGAIFPTALWHEREAFDLMGVEFKGHPDLRRILMPEDWVGHPLRKDYQEPEEYHGISTK